MVRTTPLMRVAVIGAGAWGTALALVAADAGHDVVMWARETDVVADINERHLNTRFLPGVDLPHGIVGTTDITACTGADLIILSVPTQFIRGVLTTHVHVVKGAVLVDVAKGIEQGTHLRVSEILHDIGAQHKAYVVLSGPSHAEEVGRRMPTTVVAASTDSSAADLAQDIFATEVFRTYTSIDVVGVEICGALKNVIAIAAGIIDGLGMGDNTKAALITRGLAEMARLGVALGAQHATFFGLAGLGDLFVTCTSRHSRNRFVGEQIGLGRTLEDILGGMNAVAEGVPTTRAAVELAAEHHVELPIASKVASILFDREDPRAAIRELMMRPARAE